MSYMLVRRKITIAEGTFSEIIISVVKYGVKIHVNRRHTSPAEFGRILGGSGT